MKQRITIWVQTVLWLLVMLFIYGWLLNTQAQAATPPCYRTEC